VTAERPIDGAPEGCHEAAQGSARRPTKGRSSGCRRERDAANAEQGGDTQDRE
jgi:hypothetical protein